MTIAFVAKIAAAPGSNGGATGTIDTSGSSLLLGCIAWFNGITANGTISDSKSNTWLPLTQRTDGVSAALQIFYAKNPTVGTLHSLSYTGTSVFPGIGFLAYSGVDLTSPFDQQSTGFTSSGTSIAAGSITPTQAGELVVSAFSGNTGTSGYSVNSGLTVRNNQNYTGSLNIGNADADIVQGSAAAINPTWSSASGALAAAVASFKAAAGGVASNPFLMNRGLFNGMNLISGTIRG